MLAPFNKLNSKVTLAALIIMWVIVCQITFYSIQSHYAEKITTSLTNQFRSEFYSSDNFQKLSNMVADVTRSNYIRCSKLTRLDPERIIIDFTTIQPNCDVQNRFVLLDNLDQKIEIKALSGTNYLLSFQIPNTTYFVIALWSMRTVGTLLIFLGFLIFKINEERKTLELNKYQAIADAQELMSLKLAHDIRSPLSVLNLLGGKMQTNNVEIDELFRQATNRINDIANDLLNKKNSTRSVDLIKCIHEIVDEKKLLYENIEFSIDHQINTQFHCQLDQSELRRIISNLLNNSIEALLLANKEKKTIEINVIRSKDICSLEIKDNGTGISKENLAKVGTKKFSFGKEKATESGSGIGIYSAIEYLRANGGDFKITSVAGEYTTVHISLPIYPY
jgi:signal transduction histidine kinase